MKKYLFFFFAYFILLIANANASDIYAAQSQAGSHDGSSCANAIATSALTAGNESGGNTIHLCGTITSNIDIQGGGSAGNLLTFKWESGARVSILSGYIFNPNGYSYLLFDGGVPCGPGTNCDTVEAANMTGYAAGQTGIAENTNNGSALGNQAINAEFFYGGYGGGNVEIRNLIIRNLYIHSTMGDSTGQADSGIYVLRCNTCTGNISIHDNTIHDLGNAISLQQFSSSPTISIYNNDMYRNNWAIENSGNGARTLNIYNNYFHDAKNWDTSNDAFHHNSLHNYMNAGGTDSLGSISTTTILMETGEHVARRRP